MTTVEDDMRGGQAPESDSAVAPFGRRAPRISQVDVFRTADELLVEGNRPTIDRVRMKLGRGSPNTINDHLDAWWAKLGSRLRDLPGREFPQLPERVGQTLQQLWNAALAGAHENLEATLRSRDEALAQHEHELAKRSQQLSEREQAAATRTAALEEGLGIAREQLAAANRRAEGLEGLIQERDSECNRLRTRVGALEVSSEELRRQCDAAGAAHRAERAKLLDQHAASEGRWLGEVDRARQAAKDDAKDHDREVKDLRARLVSVEAECDRMRQDLRDVRVDLRTAAAVRERLEERLRTMTSAPPRVQRAHRPRAERRRKAKVRQP
jgi:chromosome segregation ATPase